MLLNDAKALLRHAFSAGRLAHAYLLVGPPRGEAMDLALFATSMVACREGGGPCGRCEACAHVAARTWCDMLVVEPMKKSRVISVDQMREGRGDNKMPPPYLLEWLSGTSFSGGWKAAIIVSADRMNEAAANAFLKALEEPPPKTLILLVTDAPQQLLPTIRSRCQRIDVTGARPGLPEPYRGQVLSALASARHSGPLAASAVASRLCATMSAMKDAAEADARGEAKGEQGIDVEDDEIDARASARYREWRSLLFQTMQDWFRDILVLRSGGDESLLAFPEHAATLRAVAGSVALAEAMANVSQVEDIARMAEKTMPEAPVLSYWLDRMKMCPGE
jgi:DNA polymerase-3 subunit delta'